MRKPVPIAAAGLALGLAMVFGISTTANADTKRALAGSVPSWATAAAKQGGSASGCTSAGRTRTR
jgi:hypothetical protein